MCYSCLESMTEMEVVMHDMGLIHTDLKPENILFVSSEYIKVPDYKSTTTLCQQGTTRHLRLFWDLDGIIHVTLQCWLHLGRVLFGSNATAHVEKSRPSY